MIDAEIRIRCIEAAAAVPGNPNTMSLAREFYAFALEGSTPAAAPVAAEVSKPKVTRK